MAIATDREYGLVIGGESSEAASGEVRELREPATGESLAKAAMFRTWARESPCPSAGMPSPP